MLVGCKIGEENSVQLVDNVLKLGILVAPTKDHPQQSLKFSLIRRKMYFHRARLSRNFGARGYFLPHYL
jgi:hypothetical protein